MDFAKKQLEKYGWKEGQGLGRNGTGISTALKPKLKLDNAGFGHNSAEEYTNNWWNNVYNQAASNINVSVTSGNVQMKLVTEESIDISTKGYYKGLKNRKNTLEYGSFHKHSTLIGKEVVHETSSGNLEEFRPATTNILTDDELLAACEGRTAHKGARHGLKQSGKLSRLEKQEKMLLKKLKNVSLTDNESYNKKNWEKKLKKINYQKDKNKTEEPPIVSNVDNNSSYRTKNYLLSSPAKLNNNKIRKKQRKKVSFNETVTEYQTQELEDSSPSSARSDNSPVGGSSTVAVSVRLQDENSEGSRLETQNDQDEGIDCSELDPKNSDSNSDEFDVSVYKELSKKERRILRRKLKKQNEMNSKTATFLDGVLDRVGDADVNTEVKEFNGKCQKCSKRKLKFEPDDLDESDVKKSHYEDKELNKHKSLKKKQKKLEKRLNKVVNSLHSCKISDSK